MADAARVPLVKRITGLLFPKGEEALKAFAVKRMTEPWGPPELESGDYPFTWTDYYKDIAPELVRSFFSFAGLQEASGLADWKKDAVAIESQTGAARRINIDPGYIAGARLVLASTKDNAHRIYLRDGIFAEVTLCRRKGGWHSFFYTFPDFKSGDYDGFLDEVREKWKRESACNRRVHS